MDTGTAKPGQAITVTGSGFAPGSTVVFTLHSTPVEIGRADADGQGNVTLTVDAGRCRGGSAPRGHDRRGFLRGPRRVSIPLTVAASGSGETAGTQTPQTGGSVSSTGFNGSLLAGALVLMLAGALAVGVNARKRSRRSH